MNDYMNDGMNERMNELYKMGSFSKIPARMEGPDRIEKSLPSLVQGIV